MACRTSTAYPRRLSIACRALNQPQNAMSRSLAPRLATHPISPELASTNRRYVLLSNLAATLLTVVPLVTPAAAIADDAFSIDTLLPLTSSPSASTSLPKEYEETARSLASALRDAIDADLNGEEEREVRRKADPAKDLVKRFMTRWKDDPSVKTDASYVQLTGAIRELGEFYIKAGQRARLSGTVGKALLLKLDAAEAALPPPPKKKSLLPF